MKDKNGKKNEPPISNANEGWWKGWAKVFTASTLLAPRVDAVSLGDVLHDHRVIRLFCDTNALATGVAEWFLHVLPPGTQLISSAIADKEIMSWADRYKPIYAASTVDVWDARLRFLLARRLTEFPPQCTVIDRLSPDQNALMVAQGTIGGQKSSQGDLLFVELARPLVREQPRQARVLFLTGDTNVARAATSAIGPEHVLYANPDEDAAQAAAGSVLPRGFWRPAGPLGSLALPSSDRLLWNLLSAFSFLIVSQESEKWLIAPTNSVRYGGPSDWADPWVDIKKIAAERSPLPQPDAANADTPEILAVPSQAATQPLPESTSATTPETITIANPEQPAPTLVPDSSPSSEPSRTQNSGNQTPASSDEWLLPPRVGQGEKDSVVASLRPNPRLFFTYLETVAFHKGIVKTENDFQKETFRVLLGLGVLTETGDAGPRIDAFRSAWVDADLDWIHAELVHAHSGYRAVVEAIRKGGFDEVTRREEQLLPLMRALGQAVRLPSGSSPPRMGDSPVTSAKLDGVLSEWLPHNDQAMPIGEACKRALKELGLTPFRFERALLALWQQRPEYPIEGRTAGEPEKLPSDQVVELHVDGTHAWREVSPGALTFCREVPVLFLTRCR